MNALTTKYSAPLENSESLNPSFGYEDFFGFSRSPGDIQLSLVILNDKERGTPSMNKQNAISRDADKFVVRMPDTMRERITSIAKGLHTSMNSAIIQGLNAWLDRFEELNNLLEGVRLLKTSLELEKKEIAAEREALATLKSQMEAKLSQKM